MQRKCWIFILITVAALAGLGILIFVIVYVTNHNKICANAEAPYIESIKSGTENILVTWYEPPSNAECDVSYRLQYTVDFGDEKEVYTSGNSYALPAIPECSYLNVRLWIISEAGEQNDNSVSKLYRELPNPGSVTDIQFLSTEEGLEVTWTRPTGQGNCKLYYDIEVTPDIIDLEKYYSQTFTENITIPHNIYCFVLDFSISPYAIEVYIDGYVKHETYISAQAVTGLAHEISTEDSSKFIVSWNGHPREESCSLEYRVAYSIKDEVVEIITTSYHEAIFDINDCASVSVTAYRYSGLHNDAATIVVTECNGA